MKQKISVTIDEDLVSQLNNELENDLFRNKSHLVEVALKRYLNEKNKK